MCSKRSYPSSDGPSSDGWSALTHLPGTSKPLVQWVFSVGSSTPAIWAQLYLHGRAQVIHFVSSPSQEERFLGRALPLSGKSLSQKNGQDFVFIEAVGYMNAHVKFQNTAVQGCEKVAPSWELTQRADVAVQAYRPLRCTFGLDGSAARARGLQPAVIWYACARLESACRYDAFRGRFGQDGSCHGSVRCLSSAFPSATSFVQLASLARHDGISGKVCVIFFVFEPCVAGWKN